MTEAATEAGPAPHQLTPVINATDGEHDQVFGSLHVVLKEQQGFLQMVQMARTPPPPADEEDADEKTDTPGRAYVSKTVEHHCRSGGRPTQSRGAISMCH